MQVSETDPYVKGMPRLFFAGLNVRLLLLVLLAMLPALGLLLYNAAAERQRAAAFVHADTQRVARLTAAHVGQIIEGQRQLVVALSRLEPVAAQDPAGCVEDFTKLVGEYPFYSSLSAALPDGQLFCSTLALTGTVSVAERAWFQRALATGGFALGDYQKGRFTQDDIVVGAYPAYAASGELRAVVAVSLDLAWLHQLLAETQLPPGAAVSITDRNGILLSRYPDPAAWVGQTLGDGPLLDHMLAGTTATTEVAGADGVTRLYAFAPIETDGGSQMHIAVGIPTSLAYAEVDRSLGRNLLAMGVAAVLALAAARAAAEALVLRRARSLLGLTQRLAAGDLRARSGGPYGGGELAGLAQSFDQMAAALECREGQLREALRSLEMLSACNQALVRAPDEQTLLDDICRSIVEVGGYRLAWIGFEEAGTAPRLRVAAHAGDDETAPGGRYLAGLDLTLADGGPRRNPAEVALRRGEAVITVHRHAEAKGAPWQAQALQRGYHASMALPIELEGRPVGALSIYAAEANAFDADAARLLHELAGDVAFGLHALRVRAAREQAEAQLRRHADHAGTLADISRDLVEVTADETSVLEVIARRVAVRLGDACIIRLLSDDGQWLHPAGLHHVDPDLEPDLRQTLAAVPQRADEGAADLVLTSGRAVRLAQVTPEQVRTMAKPELWPLIDRLGLHSVLFVPLRAHSLILGVLNVVRGTGSLPYTAEDEAFAQDLADRAGLSLSNARLFKSLQQLNAELEARVRDRTAALQQSAAEFEDLYDQAPCGYHSLDPDGLYLRVNQYELELLGYTRDEVVGHLRFADVLTPASAQAFHERFPRFVETGHAYNLEFELLSRDGTRIPVLLSATAVRDEAGRFVMSRSTLIDITDRQQAEARIQALNEVLAQRARQLEAANAELQAFSYSVSHDLRAPLRSIDGFSLALVEDYAPQLDEPARDYLNRIRAAAQRMGELIDALLILSRVTRAELRRLPLNLSALAEAVAAELRQREPGHAVELTIAPGLTAEGDPSLVRNVLENLLSNAWKFTAGCHPARIEFGRLPDDGVGDGPVFFVRDNGAGFDMTYADRLFGAFQRLHDQRTFKGTGVGLATVQRIILRHGGRVWGEAQVGAGATFYFTLP